MFQYLQLVYELALTLQILIQVLLPRGILLPASILITCSILYYTVIISRNNRLLFCCLTKHNNETRDIPLFSSLNVNTCILQMEAMYLEKFLLLLLGRNVLSTVFAFVTFSRYFSQQYSMTQINCFPAKIVATHRENNLLLQEQMWTTLSHPLLIFKR